MSYTRKIILAGSMGNFIEAFDLALCGLLSIFLAHYLTNNEENRIWLILATFFISFLARPVGAVLLGLCSDRYGRKKTLTASIWGMGCSTALLGVIPSYTTIGLWALLCLLILRTVQNLACGAEYLNSASFLVESMHPESKGYAGSWASFGATAGTLLASIVLLCMTNLIAKKPDIAWYLWRIPFVLALFGTAIGLYVRHCIPESKAYVLYYATHEKPLFRHLLQESAQRIKTHKTASVILFLLSSLGVSFTCLIYLFPSMQVHLNHPFTEAQLLESNIVSLTVLLCALPWMGKYSDAHHRIASICGSALLLLPLLGCFLWALKAGSFYKLVLIQAIIAIPAALYYASLPAFFAELFPLRLRCTILSFLYSIATSVVGGLLPLVSLFLIEKTQNPLSPLGIVLIIMLFAGYLLGFGPTLRACPIDNQLDDI